MSRWQAIVQAEPEFAERVERLFDAGRLLRYRVSWVDLPILAWCLTPFASSVTNGPCFSPLPGTRMFASRMSALVG